MMTMINSAKEVLKTEYYAWEVYLDIAIFVLVLCGAILHVVNISSARKRPAVQNAFNNFRQINSVLLLSWIFAICSLAITISAYIIRNTPILYALNLVFSGLALTSTYVAFWYILRIFYSEKSLLRQLTNSITRFLSYFQGIFMIIGSLMLSAWVAQHALEKQCSEMGCFPRWIFASVAAIQLETHVILLILFLHPLIKHTRWMESMFNEEPCPRSRRQSGNGNQEDYIILMKKVTFATAIAVMTDISAFTVCIVFQIGTLYNIDVLCNIICITACLSDWKRRLLPCVTCCNDREDTYEVQV